MAPTSAVDKSAWSAYRGGLPPWAAALLSLAVWVCLLIPGNQLVTACWAVLRCTPTPCRTAYRPECFAVSSLRTCGPRCCFMMCRGASVPRTMPRSLLIDPSIHERQVDWLSKWVIHPGGVIWTGIEKPKYLRLPRRFSRSSRRCVIGVWVHRENYLSHPNKRLRFGVTNTFDCKMGTPRQYRRSDVALHQLTYAPAPTCIVRLARVLSSLRTVTCECSGCFSPLHQSKCVESSACKVAAAIIVGLASLRVYVALRAFSWSAE